MFKHFILGICFIVGLVALTHYVNEWEKANDYPYGMLCEAYNNCK